MTLSMKSLHLMFAIPFAYTVGCASSTNSQNYFNNDAGGDAARIQRNCSQDRWCIVPFSKPNEIQPHLLKIWGASSDQLWVVPATGNLYFWNGQQWTFKNLSTSPTVNPVLSSIHGISASHIYAVGKSDTAFWNGTAWDLMTVATNPTPGSKPIVINDVWAAPDQRAWAVGESGAFYTWSGVGGAFMGLNARAPNSSLTSIWGVSSKAMWITDNDGFIRFSNGDTILSEYQAISQRLKSIRGLNEKDIWVVGGEGAILHWDGSNWEPKGSRSTQDLNSVWPILPNDAYAVGKNGTILHWNGTTWSSQNSGTTSHLQSVWASHSNDVWAVGENGTVLHYEPQF